MSTTRVSTTQSEWRAPNEPRSKYQVVINNGLMRRLREAIHWKWKDLWENNSRILHYDNASSHSAIIIRQFLPKRNRIPEMSQKLDQTLAVDGEYFEGVHHFCGINVYYEFSEYIPGAFYSRWYISNGKEKFPLPKWCSIPYTQLCKIILRTFRESR